MRIYAKPYDEDECEEFEEEEYDGYNSDFEDCDKNDNFLYDEDDYNSDDSDYEEEY